MSYDTLIPLVKKTGSTLSPKEFQNAVNVIFHDVEANYYDSLHQNMWQSLQEQIDLLVEDLLSKNELPNNLSLLDVGCGTGLSTQLLLRSKLGPHIQRITLLDTSPNMLKQAEERSKEWGKEVETFNSLVTGVTKKYDIILVCSVLHHVPDLKEFFDHIAQIQNSGGIFIHLQDPNGDYLNDPEFVKRTTEYAKHDNAGTLKRTIGKLLPPVIKNFINAKFRREPYIDQVNNQLIERNIIKKAMSPEEIWSVTDIHVETLPYSTQTGISFKYLKETLQPYECITHRSYGFYGLLKSEIPEHFQQLEVAHTEAKELNGRLISVVWRKK